MPTDIDQKPTQLLSDLSDSKASGCLELEETGRSWKIYLQEGNLQYAYFSIQTLEQFKYHLHCLGFTSAIQALKKLPAAAIDIQNNSAASNIYSKVMSWLLSNQIIDLVQSCRLIQSLSKENLKYSTWLDRASSKWHSEQVLPLWINAKIKSSLSLVNLSEFLTETNNDFRKWQACSDKFVSVYQRPYFAPGWQSKELPASASLNHQSLVELTKILQGRTSLRQLSMLLKKDEFQVAKILSPYIDNQIIYLHHPATPCDRLPDIPRSPQDIIQFSSADINRGLSSTTNNTAQKSIKTWKIVCIDDSPTILSEIKRFLDEDKFEITTLDDPIQAVSRIFTIKPDLILLDITMPKINGYKLCGLLRNSGKCNNTPIVMVTGNTGLIDKARAKLSGATDYFTKPFTKEGLNSIVNKHIPF